MSTRTILEPHKRSRSFVLTLVYSDEDGEPVDLTGASVYLDLKTPAGELEIRWTAKRDAEDE